MNLKPLYSVLKSSFTFQYGSTQILLKFYDVINRYQFTFQYGSTQIFDWINGSGHVDLFTFQYGSTQIKLTDF